MIHMLCLNEDTYIHISSITLFHRIAPSGPQARGRGAFAIPMLYYSMLYYNILYCAILYYTILYYTIMYYTVDLN